MKVKLIALLTALLLLLAACAAPAPESGNASPPESTSDLESVDVSHYYIEDPEKEGIEDKEAAEALCWYLRGNLSPKDYSSVHDMLEVKYGDETHENYVYYVDVYGPSRDPLDAMLRDYDGPYAPIAYHPLERTLLDLWRAKEDMDYFLLKHRDIEVVFYDTNDWESMCHVIEVAEITDELTAFVESYPVKGIYSVYEYVEMLNPD